MRHLSLLVIAVSMLGCGPAQPAPNAPASSVGPKNQDETALLRAEVEKLTAEVATLKVMVQQLATLESRINELDARLSRAGEHLPAPSRPRPPSPDPAAVYAIPIAGTPYRGPKDAPVTIVRGFEFACPYCERSRGTMDQLLDAYPGELKIVYKQFIVHPQTATVPALAACAAGRQGKYFEMANLIWDKAYASRDFSEAKMDELAKSLGLDVGILAADMTGPCTAVIETEQRQLAAVGTRGTPSFYINGRHLSGAQPIDKFKALVDEELARARDRIKAGDATVETYYQKYVLEAGKTSL